MNLRSTLQLTKVAEFDEITKVWVRFDCGNVLAIPSLSKTDLVLGSSEGDAWLPPVAHLNISAANVQSYLIQIANANKQ